jgi:hypothetical protein
MDGQRLDIYMRVLFGTRLHHGLFTLGVCYEVSWLRILHNR